MLFLSIGDVTIQHRISSRLVEDAYPWIILSIRSPSLIESAALLKKSKRFICDSGSSLSFAPAPRRAGAFLM